MSSVADGITGPFAAGRYSDRLRVTIDDSPICCEAPRQAVERPQEATWPGQGFVSKGQGRKSHQRPAP